ncbi:type VI secretion system-associated protein TagF [Enterobacillus tribolii]|uniref:Type VI secretion system protein ImpM n=1 Tax=Enterobacillus tribolii TaxID=1487935 RepID=A0A370Q6X1_9GAMM|nr:type VI secretion system-associated protein TagF [Enterobacillus tribolii]MBW7984910.1 type VI secretion system-associated protein TagF [Enterobacillus tribolii]RDK84122.1 type VI secretion system protein ImpM [Enterobacillus tribolii]
MNSVQNTTTAPGWYGKLPATGDFLQRRLPAPVVNHWAQWFHNGLAGRQRRQEEMELPPFSAAPVWNFVVPATLGNRYIQMGCMMPACDSVGRNYPVCAMQLFSPDDWHPYQLNMSAEWYQHLGFALLRGVRNILSAEQVDQSLQALMPLSGPPEKSGAEILSVIGFQHPDVPPLSWQQVADCFDPEQYSSFWWTNQADGAPLYTHVHSGNLTVQLFTQLFEPTVWNRPGRGGQYPQMFD